MRPMCYWRPAPLRWAAMIASGLVAIVVMSVASVLGTVLIGVISAGEAVADFWGDTVIPNSRDLSASWWRGFRGKP